MGIQAELAGSATGKAFRVIDDAVRNGGEAMQHLQALTGETGEVLKLRNATLEMNIVDNRARTESCWYQPVGG